MQTDYSEHILLSDKESYQPIIKISIKGNLWKNDNQPVWHMLFHFVGCGYHILSVSEDLLQPELAHNDTSHQHYIDPKPSLDS